MEKQKPTTSEWIAVKKSNIHATGVFAAKDIPKGTRVIEYVGNKVTKKESDYIADRDLDAHAADSDHGAVYIFELNKKWDIDGNVSWNTARLINHSCSPNCETDIIDDHIWIISTKKILKGQEITYDYGYDMDNWQDHPCRCGSKNCIGYIVAQEHWPKLRKKLKRLKEKEKREKMKKNRKA